MDKILSFERNDSDDYYSILGCSEHSTEEQITTEYRARVLDCHPDKHPGDAEAAQRFTLLTKAKEILTDPDSRSKYDKWRHSGIAMSYEDWCGLRGAVHTSMHWATKAPQPQIVAADSEMAGTSRKSRDSDRLDAESQKNRERSPVPQQASSYHRAQQIDLTFSSRDKPFATGDQVKWIPQAGTGLLKKFRNYEI
ncbi:J domain-containing protein-like [Babylonia areolata]|uniref:J domain-containing protein-like n=1 Tax=Babylonia areolata TaxID=304850 RepID=UPI003FD308D1